MKRISTTACLAVLLAPGIAAAAEYGCEYVVFGDEVTKEFPRIADVCRSVTTRNDEPYAKFTTEVVSANSETVVVNVLDKKDKPVSKVTFATNPDVQVSVDGHRTKLKDLKRGTRSNFYVAHNRWGLYADPASPKLTILSREEP